MEYYNFVNKILLVLFILIWMLVYKLRKVKAKDYRRRFRYLIYWCVIVIVLIPVAMFVWSPSFSSLESAARHSGITIEDSPMMKGKESVMILERKDEGGFASSLYYENKGRWKNKWLNPWAKDFYRTKKLEDSLVYEVELVRDGTTEGRYIILHLENQENEEKGEVTDTLGTRFLSAVNKKRWGIQKVYCAYLKETPPADYQIFLNGNKINIDWKQFRLKDKNKPGEEKLMKRYFLSEFKKHHKYESFIEYMLGHSDFFRLCIIKTNWQNRLAQKHKELQMN